MRSMEINKTTVFYALYTGKQPILDDNGDETGEYTSGYALPVQIRIRVSPNRGEATNQLFGTLLDYDSTMVTNDVLPIDEFSILWIGKAPVLNDGAYHVDLDSNLITGHTHAVVRVAKDINVTQYAIKKIN